MTKPRRLNPAERKVGAVAGTLALVLAFLLFYFGGHGFAFLGILLSLVGLMCIVWATFGKYY